MITSIYTSKKLEKLTGKLISKSPQADEEQGILGKWNANIFYVSRKKCWLVTNSRSRYSVILPDITASSLNKINDIFKNNLYSQIIYDGVFMDYSNLDNLIGRLQFHPTDNDRRTIGFQNTLFDILDYRKAEYGQLENIPLKRITHYINHTLFHWDKPTMANSTNPVAELKKLLEDDKR